MKIIKESEIQNNLELLENEIKAGKIFIYPTDTIYGIGCDATNEKSVEKIFQIKKRENNPCLILAPDKTWIKNNTTYHKNHQIEIDNKLPGPYSFITNLNQEKDHKISKLALANRSTIGIRILDNEFSNLLKNIQIPFISTSVNLSGEPTIKKIGEIPKEILDQIDYLITTETSLLEQTSKIFDITQKEIKKLR